MDRQHKRVGAFGMDSTSNKKTKFTNGSVGHGSSTKMTFAQRMMAKMGHKEGEGLGKEGCGIVNPIEVKLRPQGAGVGVIKEKTPQAKAEARRAAEQRGENYQDSSEEERKIRRRAKKALETGNKSVAFPKTARPKQRVRTAAEIEVEDGLHVPDVFKAFIDHTGAQPKQLTSSADLAPTRRQLVKSETESDKLAKHARIELEAFASAWREVNDRKQYLELQYNQLQTDHDCFQSDERTAERLKARVDLLTTSHLESGAQTSSSLETYAEALSSQLESIDAEFKDESEKYGLGDVAVAALGPVLKQSIDDWSPFGTQPSILPYFRQTMGLLHVPPNDHFTTDSLSIPNAEQNLSTYDSFMFSTWFPKIRTAFTNEWEPHDPSAALNLLDHWTAVLPKYVYRAVVDQLVVQKLFTALKSWRPRESEKHSPTDDQPHQWIFPWLDRLDPYHRDPHSSNGLLAEVRRRYCSALASWNPAKGTIDGIEHWRNVDLMKDDLDKDLQTKLLPRLAQYLHDTFEVDPSDQDITPIEQVLLWQPFFTPDKFARVFLDAFFPKWHNVLYLWLTSEPNYEEVGQWLEWWQSCFPDSLNLSAAMSAQWTKGLTMINDALELGPEGVKSGLAVPVNEAAVTANEDDIKDAQEVDLTSSNSKSVQDGATMREILEDLCEQEDLLLVPLRKAHPETGLPLLRITASATSGGGIVVYIKGDVVWAQNRRERSVWQPIDAFAEGVLSHLAEAP